MKKTLLLALLLAPLLSLAQSYAGPESVDCDTLTGNWYISNTGSKKILRRTPAGDLQEFLSGFTSGPYGIEVVGDRIYACDGNKIKGFLLADGSPVFSVTTNGGFLNGIAHDSSGFLYASDFSGKKIFKVNPANNSWNVFVNQTGSTPNGLLYDEAANRLVCVCWGGSAKILGISLADSSVTTLKTTTLSNIDGVARDGAGRWYVASWGANAIHRINADFSGTPQLVLSGMSQPADIYYNLQSDTLGIPNSGNNTVVFAGFAPVSALQQLRNEEQVHVFPNPATDVVQIQLPEGWQATKTSCRVLTADGKEQPFVLLQNEASRKVISVKNLPAGMYRILLTQGAQTITTAVLRG